MSSFRSLGLRFALAVDPHLEVDLETLLGPMRSELPASSTIEVCRTTGGRFSILLDGEERVHSVQADLVLSRLIHLVTMESIEHSAWPLLLHGGCVEIDGAPVIVVGSSGSGKSTTVLGAACGGAGFLTDEVVAIDSDGALVDWVARPVKASSVPTGCNVVTAMSPSADGTVHVACRSATHVNRGAGPAVGVLWLRGLNGAFEVEEMSGARRAEALLANAFAPRGRTRDELGAAASAARRMRSGIAVHGGTVDERLTLISDVAR